MPIDIRQLRFAVMAADASSFLGAAKKLNVKQSTLSKRVGVLERRLGITLFERSTRGVVLTDPGRAFIEVARRIVRDVDGLRDTAKAVRSGLAGQLSMGFSCSLSSGNLRLVLGDILKDCPGVELDIQESRPDQMLSALQSRLIDVAIHACQISAVGLAHRPLWSERLMLVLPRNHYLLDLEKVFWTDLRDAIFAFSKYSTGPTVTRVIRQRLAAHGFEANILVQSNSTETIASLVPYGKFITAIPESAAIAVHPDVAICEIAEPTGTAHLDFAAWWSEDNDNPVLARLFRLVDKRYPSFSTS
ncbi:DNA-binding transcriptional LysR family regulator [Altererythrobacter atlanticus]|uniref:HTH-type transcriptional regulator GltC n=1 Tax=Croceibacterium atlanticum TaxID=1267766 RepID=A0A0F7KTI3_9SPHN|nr:LysR family transcriptional regulator [Croceibacterium atlanticum]AKH43723.1 HTH-type transcriptional regulator GltC [Croceibacterium atlanticum]MBB5734264.1 DNA-binding transcriptional LysR family regulator [Croceibacterium atlanticum]